MPGGFRVFLSRLRRLQGWALEKPLARRVLSIRHGRPCQNISLCKITSVTQIQRLFTLYSRLGDELRHGKSPPPPNIGRQ